MIRCGTGRCLEKIVLTLTKGLLSASCRRQALCFYPGVYFTLGQDGYRQEGGRQFTLRTSLDSSKYRMPRSIASLEARSVTS